ncbi:MAG TPA: hypothetical protein VIF57_27425 [Polyangia bacterium]
MTGWASLIVLAGGLAACGRVPGQFEILQNQAPQGGCAITTDRMTYRGEGTIDLSLVSPGAETAYFMFPLVINNLPGSTGGEPDGNEIDVHSFAVDIGTTRQSYLPPNVQMLFDHLNEMPGSHDYALLHYSLPWAVTISSGGGLAATLVNAFPVELAQRVLATGDIGVSASSMTVNARVRVFGTTNTQDMESDPFDFPISVCNGCLVHSLLPCPVTSAPTFGGNACNLSQDNLVDCCSLNGALVCPPIVSGTQ